VIKVFFFFFPMSLTVVEHAGVAKNENVELVLVEKEEIGGGGLMVERETRKVPKGKIKKKKKKGGWWRAHCLFFFFFYISTRAKMRQVRNPLRVPGPNPGAALTSTYIDNCPGAKQRVFAFFFFFYVSSSCLHKDIQALSLFFFFPCQERHGQTNHSCH
jgi:hypothetical protein